MNEHEFEDLHYKDAPQIVTELPGPKSKLLFEKQDRFETRAVRYVRHFPSAWESGKGATIRDIDGNIFIDWFTGPAVLNVGHGNPKVIEAAIVQLRKLSHVLDVPTEARINFLEKMQSILPGDLNGNGKIFFCVSGSDANEAAIKLSRYVTKKQTLISFDGALHGMTMGALAVSSLSPMKTDIGPLMPGVFRAPYAYCYRCPFNRSVEDCSLECVEYLRHSFRDPYSGLSEPVGIIVEPAQGEGGYIFPPNEFLKRLKEIADENCIPLIVDEIQTGLGRTGKMWASEWSGITPDILTISKSIAAGIPIAAIAYRKEYDDQLPDVFHLGTYRGNPVGCAAGFEVMKFIQEAQLPERTLRLGKIMIEALRKTQEESKYLGDVRGKGLMIGLEFVKDKKTKDTAQDICRDVLSKCYKMGLVAMKAGRWGNCIRLAPPLVITDQLVLKGLEIMQKAIKSVNVS